MPSSQNGNIGLNSGYTAGDNGWTAQHNFNWDALDALVQPTVKSVSTTTPPGSPANGDAYIVPAGATGAWASQTNKIAAWQRSAWAFYTPKNGWQVYNQADGGDYLYNGTAWVLQGSQKLNVSQDYISGLKMVWNSGTSISVTSGAAYISSLGRLCQVNVTLTLSSLSLTASTWYHLYLYENAGTPTLECVTTAPAAAYYGTARAKTGDTSRRYVGSVKTDASGNVFQFIQNGDSINYLMDVALTPAITRILAGGTATTATTVAASGCVPVTSKLMYCNIAVVDTSAACRIGNSEMGGGGGLSGSTAFLNVLAGTNREYIFAIVPTDSSQAIQYLLSGTVSGGGLYIDVSGYQFER